MKRTYAALISREIAVDLAQDITNAGLTLKKLKQMNFSELLELGLTEISIKAIQNSPRPSIDSDVVKRLMIDSQRTCCVCKNIENPIIIHHIKEWSVSRDHSESNLVVLCLNCHDRAHTKHTLSNSLSESQIKAIKQDWYRIVRDNAVNTAKAGCERLNLQQSTGSDELDARVVENDPFLISYESGRDIGPALLGRSLGPSDAIACPKLDEVGAVLEELSICQTHARLYGVPGAGKSICAFQVGFSLYKQGWRVYQLESAYAQTMNSDLFSSCTTPSFLSWITLILWMNRSYKCLKMLVRKMRCFYQHTVFERIRCPTERL